MELVALSADFGVEVRGIGLIDVASSDSAYRATRAALDEYGILLFREQDVTDDVQAAFSRAFGPLERVKIGSVGAGTFYSRLGKHGGQQRWRSRLQHCAWRTSPDSPWTSCIRGRPVD